MLLDAIFLTVEDGVSEAMLVITVESGDESSATCSFPLSDIDSKATSLLQYCQSVTPARALPFPWMTAGACRNSVCECMFLLSHLYTTLPLYFHIYVCIRLLSCMHVRAAYRIQS